MARLIKVKPVDLEKRLRLSSEESGIHSVVRRTLLAGRIMGLLPVSGLNQSKIHNLKFEVLSLYGVLYAVSLTGQVCMGLMANFRLFHVGFSLTSFTNAMFYSSSMVSTFILLFIGKNWPRLVFDLEKIEQKLPPFKRNLSNICNMTMITVLLLAMVEHLLSVFYGVIAMKRCPIENVLEAYFVHNMPWLFEYTPYALWKGILAEAFNIQATFLWTYEDVFIMVISIYLTEHFHIHNEMLKHSLILEGSYTEFRAQYLEIVHLIKLVNRYIGICIVISFGGNLYWICMQLFYSLNQNQTGHLMACRYLNQPKRFHELEHEVYFVFSFSFLFARAFLVLLLASRIHTASLAPLSILYSVPSAKYDIEIERYIYQINNMKVALSGLDFFHVTRRMILSLIGTIVTYELVLLQFNR